MGCAYNVLGEEQPTGECGTGELVPLYLLKMKTPKYLVLVGHVFFIQTILYFFKDLPSNIDI